MLELSLEKEFTHQHFCHLVESTEDVDFLREQLKKFHLLYLTQQTLVAQMAKDYFSSLPKL